jgi:hypothetical protein
MIGAPQEIPAESGRSAVPFAARIAAFAVGSILVGLALLALWRHRETLDAAVAALRSPPAWAVAAMPLSVLASIAIGGLLLKRLLHRHPGLPGGELVALNAAATLFNLLPLKPGLAARIAWQRRHHGVAVATSLRASVALVLLSATAVGLAVGGMLLARAAAVPGSAGLLALGGLLLVLCRHGRFGLLAELLWWRLLDLGAWAVRIAAAFAAIAAPIDADAAIALACVAMAVGAVPVVGATLGVREWAIAALAPLLAGIPWENALAAELLGRAVEVLVLIPAGLAATWWLWRGFAGEPPSTRRAPAA